MSIPNNEKTRLVMEFLFEQAQSRPHDRISVSDLRAASGLTGEECRFLTNTFFATGLLHFIDSSTFQVDPIVLQYEQRMFVCNFGDVHSFAQEQRAMKFQRSILPIILAANQRQDDPAITLKAILEFGGKNDDGRLVKCVAIPWFEIMEMIRKDPTSIYQIDPFKWEEIIAGAYSRAGFDEVILTPRSGDNGRDVVATKKGIGSIRIFDQVKAYRPGHLVTAEEVRAMAGTIDNAGNVSKGVITTTSDFAPRIVTHDYVSRLIPFRLELKNRDQLLEWLSGLQTQ